MRGMKWAFQCMKFQIFKMVTVKQEWCDGNFLTVEAHQLSSFLFRQHETSCVNTMIKLRTRHQIVDSKDRGALIKGGQFYFDDQHWLQPWCIQHSNGFVTGLERRRCGSFLSFLSSFSGSANFEESLCSFADMTNWCLISDWKVLCSFLSDAAILMQFIIAWL